MKKATLDREVAAVKSETKTALQTMYDAMNNGQQKQIVKNQEVKALFDGVVPFHGMYMDFGPSAVVKIRNTIVIVTTQHRNNGDPHLYRAFGYDPAEFQMVVVKACTSYRAFYAPLTDLMYPTSTKGAATSDLLSLPYKKIPKSFYPFSDGEFAPEPLCF